MVLPSNDADDMNDIRQVFSHTSEHHYPSQRVPGPLTKSDALENVESAQDEDAVYEKFSETQKRVMTAIVAYCSLCAPFSTTCIFSATPEIASDFHTTGTIINVTNAVYLVMMAISPLYWGPMSQIYGRKPIYIASSFGYFIGSLGTSVSVNLAMFIVFRCITAFAGTSFLAVGAGTIGDIYKPVHRGSAMGLYLAGVTIGPAFGPVVSGMLQKVTEPWEDVFWLTTALGGLAFLLCVFCLPETAHHRIHDDLKKEKEKKFVWVTVNPLRPLALYIYPNLLLTAITSSSVLWSMYSLLTPIRYVINPRFHIDSPALSGLFNLAPGCGYLVGTFIGGRYADYSVRKWLVIRGRRLPEDRLRSILYMLIFLLPSTILIYGWSIDQERGGIAVPVIALFFNGIAQLVVFASLNTYCVDVLQARSTEVIGANYAMRYVFAAAASSSILPLIDRIGVGWATTISAGLLLLSGFLTWLTIWKGESWRLKVDARLAQRLLEKEERKTAA